MSQVKNISKKYNIEENDKRLVKLRSLLSNNMGYFYKMSEWVFKDGTELSEIENILQILNIVKINKPITDFKSSEELYDFVCEVQNKQKLNQIVKCIPSRSRENLSKRIKDLIYNNIELEKEFRDFLSKKGGSCKSEDDLYQNILEVINLSKGSSDYSSFLNKVKRKINYTSLIILLKYIIKPWSILNFKKSGQIVYKDGETIIVKINTFSLSAVLGSRHWCISRNLSYWNSYTKDNRTQYFIFQTNRKDNKSSIGVTVQPYGNSIYTAHLKDDRGASIGDYKKYLPYLKGYEGIPKNVSEMVKYNLYDIEMLMKVPNWESIFDNFNEKYLFNIAYDISKRDSINTRDLNNIKKFMKISLSKSSFLSIPNIVLSHFVDNNNDYTIDENSKLTFAKIGFLIIQKGYDNLKITEFSKKYNEILDDVEEVVKKNDYFHKKWLRKDNDMKYELIQKVCKEVIYQKKYTCSL